MGTSYGANVTKVRAGGSGDNIVKDGYIKTVEKVWIDSFAITAFTQINSNSSIVIAQVPRGKKITDVIVHLPVLGALATSSTVWCSYKAFSPTSGTPSLGTLQLTSERKTAAPIPSMATLRLDSAYIGSLVPTSSTSSDPMDIHITFGFTGDATIVTFGTIKSVVKYT